TGEIPKELGGLTNLQYLYLYNNQLTGEIPKELGSLSNLTDLRLFNNQLTGKWDAYPSGVPEVFAISDRIILHIVPLAPPNSMATGNIPKELGSLINLTVLSLYENKLTG
ncbi:unnamed protein product, partial [Phaeothamnion confervicola]